MIKYLDYIDLTFFYLYIIRCFDKQKFINHSIISHCIKSFSKPG